MTRPARRRLLGALAAVVATAGCVTVHDTPSAAGAARDEVLLVGRIELVPPLRPGEQRIDLGLDPFNTRRYYEGRAVLFLGTTPDERDRTGNAINPELEQTFAIAVPRTLRHVVGGGVAMDLNLRTVSSRQAVLDQMTLRVPVPLTLDLRPDDRAVYLGTLRLHRDEFHSVVRAEVRDEQAAAAAAVRQRFDAAPPLRKALLRLPKH